VQIVCLYSMAYTEHIDGAMALLHENTDDNSRASLLHLQKARPEIIKVMRDLQRSQQQLSAKLQQIAFLFFSSFFL